MSWEWFFLFFCNNWHLKVYQALEKFQLKLNEEEHCGVGLLWKSIFISKVGVTWKSKSNDEFNRVLSRLFFNYRVQVFRTFWILCNNRGEYVFNFVCDSQNPEKILNGKYVFTFRIVHIVFNYWNPASFLVILWRITWIYFNLFLEMSLYFLGIFSQLYFISIVNFNYCNEKIFNCIRLVHCYF